MQLKRYGVIVIILIIIVLFFIFKTGVLSINQVDVEINNATCVQAENIKSDLNLAGKNILLLNSGEINRKLINKYFCIKQVKLNRQFPRVVKLIVEGRVAIAQVSFYKRINLDNLESTPSSSAALLDWSFPSLPEQSLLLDDTGLIFGTGGKSDLPALFLEDQSLKISSRLNPEFVKNISMLFDGLKKINIIFSKVKVSDGFLQIETGPKLTFSTTRDILSQLASLQLILQKAKIDGKIMEAVDLRFDKPVVIYFSKK